jgi:uncharacterized Zn-binding protein involved in type VI secretion
MGKAVARGDSVDTVSSLTGSGGINCPSPVTTSTHECSANVFVNGVGVVRIGDAVYAHIAAGCGIDASTLTTSSSTVFANGKGVARKGDQYTSDNTITSGSPTVFAG